MEPSKKLHSLDMRPYRVTVLFLSFSWHLVSEDGEKGIHVALKFQYFLPHLMLTQCVNPASCLIILLHVALGLGL